MWATCGMTRIKERALRRTERLIATKNSGRIIGLT